ncbi:MAG: flagellar protein FlaG [Betaproteobacteria bacterium]
MQPIAIGVSAPGSRGSSNASSPRSNAADAPAETANVPDREQLKKAVDSANSALKTISSELEFAIDASTSKTVVRVIDSATQQVIRQIPSEEMLAIARSVDRMQGLLLKQKA